MKLLLEGSSAFTGTISTHPLGPLPLPWSHCPVPLPTTTAGPAPGRPTDTSGTRSRSSWSLLNAGNVLHAKKLPGPGPMVATKSTSYRNRTVGCSRYALCFSQKPAGRDSARPQGRAGPGRAPGGGVGWSDAHRGSGRPPAAVAHR